MAAVIAALTIITAQHYCIQKLKDDRNRQERNVESLMNDVSQYKVRDSLNAARVEALELTMKEYAKFRAEDAALVKELQGRNRELSAINKAQEKTIIDLRATPKDTILVKDSIAVPALAFHCGDAWYDFNGILAQGEFTGTLENRDSLLIAESVKYKRFLGFLWKTHKIADRRIDAVSKNPHTKIIGLECVVIEK